VAKAKKTGGKRRSKAESMTGAKENETEVRKGELALGEPVQIESKDFHFHMRAIKAALERKDSAVAVVRSSYKAANAVNPHLGGTIKDVIAMERADDPASLKQKLEVLGIALKETGSPVQLSVHDILMGDPKDVAYKRGKDAGANGQTLANPYPVGSDLAEQYQTGWRNGMGGNAGLTPEQTQAAINKQDEATLAGEPLPPTDPPRPAAA